MLEIFTLIAICITLVPGVSFFIKHALHRKLMKKNAELDVEVNKWRDNRDPAKLNEVVEERSGVIDKIFKFQNDMERSTYFLAAGACSFAIIEAYKLISHFIHTPCV